MSNRKPTQPEDVVDTILDAIENVAYEGTKFTERTGIKMIKKTENVFDRILGFK